MMDLKEKDLSDAEVEVLIDLYKYDPQFNHLVNGFLESFRQHVVSCDYIVAAAAFAKTLFEDEQRTKEKEE